ncbi:hypothetical protein KCU61_g809, partial [Aureobasidium melanogenum]
MLFLVEVVVDLVQIARVTASLFLRVLTANGRHRGFLVAVTVAVCRDHAKLFVTRLLRKLMQPAWNFYFRFAKHLLSSCSQIKMRAVLEPRFPEYFLRLLS